MPEQRKPRDLVVRGLDHAGMLEESFHHPFNPNSELHRYDLGERAGLTRMGVSLARVPPHRESFAKHSHAVEEEWLFVLRGRGLVEIGDAAHEIVPGDFVGFPAGSDAHHVRNPYQDELVYLCGGERSGIDVVDYPVAGKRVVRVAREMTVYPVRAGEPLFP